MGEKKGDWPLKVHQAVVVQAGTTQQVLVKWPVLKNEQLRALQGLGVECFHVQGHKMANKPAQLVMGVASLRNGSQKYSQRKLLFPNDTEHNIVLTLALFYCRARRILQGLVTVDAKAEEKSGRARGDPREMRGYTLYWKQANQQGGQAAGGGVGH